MKKYFAALTTTALISAAPFALASSTDLTVKGIITPVACTPTFDKAVIDFGKISSSRLSQTSNTLIGEPDLQLVVACDAANSFALNPIDNKSGTSIGNWFGLDVTEEGAPLGQFVPKVVQITDGTNTLDAIKSIDGTTWEKATDAQPGYLLSFTSSGGSDPIAAKEVTFDFKVETYIARADSLKLENDVDFEGSATFEVKYL